MITSEQLQELDALLLQMFEHNVRTYNRYHLEVCRMAGASNDFLTDASLADYANQLLFYNFKKRKLSEIRSHSDQLTEIENFISYVFRRIFNGNMGTGGEYLIRAERELFVELSKIFIEIKGRPEYDIVITQTIKF